MFQLSPPLEFLPIIAALAKKLVGLIASDLPSPFLTPGEVILESRVCRGPLKGVSLWVRETRDSFRTL